MAGLISVYYNKTECYILLIYYVQRKKKMSINKSFTGSISRNTSIPSTSTACRQPTVLC